MRLLLLPALAVLLSSCGLKQTCWSGGIPLRDIEERQRGAAVSDFGDTSNLKAYRGLAHPQNDKARYEKQVAKGGWVEFEGFKFFEEPLDFPKERLDEVLEIYADPDSHQAWGPKTKCPHFHPDYALVWSSGGRQRVLQLCFGCHEWKFFGPRGMLLTDISEKAYNGRLTRKLLPRER